MVGNDTLTTHAWEATLRQTHRQQLVCESKKIAFLLSQSEAQSRIENACGKPIAAI